MIQDKIKCDVCVLSLKLQKSTQDLVNKNGNRKVEGTSVDYKLKN